MHQRRGGQRTARPAYIGTTEEMKDLCWPKPRRVAQISFTDGRITGLLRRATFEGLRDDIEPRSVVREVAAG